MTIYRKFLFSFLLSILFEGCYISSFSSKLYYIPSEKNNIKGSATAPCIIEKDDVSVSINYTSYRFAEKDLLVDFDLVIEAQRDYLITNPEIIMHSVSSGNDYTLFSACCQYQDTLLIEKDTEVHLHFKNDLANFYNDEKSGNQFWIRLFDMQNRDMNEILKFGDLKFKLK